MFSIWPELFAFQLLAIAVLRVSVGYLFLLTGSRLMRATKNATDVTVRLRVFGILYSLAWLTIGSLLTVGAFTQPVALAGAILAILPIGMHTKSTCERNLTYTLFILCLSLIFLGPGVPAFDLPI
jgi:hypothetical protein